MQIVATSPSAGSEDVFRLGLVGAGRMGRTHLRALAGSAKLQVVAVAEPDEATCGMVRDQFSVDTYTCLEELLERESVDGLLIATPTDTHVAALDTAIGAGVPALCEKPCGARPEDAQHVLERASSGSVPVQVAYWRRFVPSLQELRGRIQTGDFGDVLSVSCDQWDGEPPAAAFRARSGGIFIDMGVHEIDEVRWLLSDEVASVAVATSGTVTEPAFPSDPDAAFAILEMAGRETVLVSLGRHFPGGDMVRVELFATKGHVLDEFLTPATGEAVFLDALRRQAVAFVDYAKGAPCAGATAQDAVRALEVAAQAQRKLEGR